MSIKRTLITTVLALALVVVAAPAVQADQLSDLMAQIQALTAQLNALQGTSGASTGTTGSCVGVTFTRNLTVGSTGTDVRCLQQLVGNTITGTFGANTKIKVKAFQASKGISTTGTVGPLTRAALTTAMGAVVPPTDGGVVVPPTGGTEGSITVTKAVSPISGAEMAPGASNVAVIAADVKATGSNVTVNRVDLLFDTAVVGTSCNIRPWLNIASVTVSDGTTSKTVPVTSASTIENTIGSSYTVRAEGLNILVPKDTTKKVTVSVNAVSALPSGATTCTSTVKFAANAVRATDTLGVSQTGPTGVLSSNTFVVKTGDNGTLTVSSASDNPKARNISIQELAQTDKVVLMKFTVEAKNNDVVLRTIRIQANSSDTLATVMPTVTLLDGTTELASTSTAASSTFDALTTVVAKGTTKTFTVVGTIAKQSGNYSEGTWVSANITATDVVGEDVTNFATVIAGGSNLDPAKGYAYIKAPTFALVSSSIINVTPTSGSSSQAADATIRFNVTANGGDVYVRNMSAVAASSGIVTAAQSGDATSTVAWGSYTTNATSGTNAWKVSSGDTKYFEITTRLTNAAEYAATYSAGALLNNVYWATSDSAIDGDYNNQTWGLDDIKTGSVFLNPRL